MCRVRVGVLGIATHLLPLLRSSVPPPGNLAPESWKKQAEQLLEGRSKSQMVTRRRRRQAAAGSGAGGGDARASLYSLGAEGRRRASRVRREDVAACRPRACGRREGVGIGTGGDWRSIWNARGRGRTAPGKSNGFRLGFGGVGCFGARLWQSIPRPLLLTNGTRVPFSCFILRVLSSLAAAAWRRLLDFPGRRGGVLPCEHTRVAFGFAI